MHDGLDIFRLASARAGHAAARQAVIARNIAHADTPGYRARDLPDFAATHGTGPGPARESFPLIVTRPGHRAAPAHQPSSEARPVERPGDASPNGNSVSLESEMVGASQAKQAHDLALATYRSGLDLLRTALGRGR